MGLGSRFGAMWSRERQAWLDNPRTWKLFLVLSLPPMVTAMGRADSDPWFAVVGLMLGIVGLTLALLAYRVAKRASDTDSTTR